MRTSSRSEQQQLHRALAAYVDDVASLDDSRQIQLLGTGAVAELEDKLCRLVGMKYAVCVSSATTGLMVAGLALGLSNRAFVTTPLSYGAALAGWLAIGGRPVFADVDSVTLGLDPEAVKRRVRNGRGVAALLAVDMHGVPSDTVSLRQVSDELGLPYIADAAESLGARVDGAHASHAADIVVTSFTSGKTLFAGEGGAVLTNDSQIYERLLKHGQHPYRQRLHVASGAWNECGVNARIHPLGAIWANARFDAAFRQQDVRRRRARRALEPLRRLGLVEPTAWEREGLEPAVFRVSAALKLADERASALERAEHVAPKLLPDRPLALLTAQPAIRACAAAQDGEGHCPVAVDQVRRRLVWRLAD